LAVYPTENKVNKYRFSLCKSLGRYQEKVIFVNSFSFGEAYSKMENYCTEKGWKISMAWLVWH
jgi:hypothetical protein